MKSLTADAIFTTFLLRTYVPTYEKEIIKLATTATSSGRSNSIHSRYIIENEFPQHHNKAQMPLFRSRYQTI